MCAETDSKWSSWRGFSVIAVLIFCICASAAFDAQTNGSTIQGKVIDSSGLPVSNARISVRNLQANTAQTLLSDRDGLYVLRNIPPGEYELAVSASGFPAKMLHVTVAANSRAVANVVMPSPVASSAGPPAKAGSQNVRDIPLNGRSATDVATLEPGVATTRTQSAGGAAQRGFGTQITISGGRPRQNDSRFEGMSVNDYANSPPGSAAGVNLGVDAVEQVSVLSNNYPAQYGRSSGGIVSSFTRSGSNAWHGSAFEFIRNSALDARNFFDIRKPPFRRNQFGGTLGGPLWKKKTFVFGAYEGFRQSLGISQVSTVPSAAARGGKLSSGQINVDPGVLRFLNAFYPLPNGSILSNGDAGIFNFAGQQVVPDNYYTVKVDHRMAANDVISGTYMLDNASARQPDELNDKRTGYDSHRQLVTGNEVHTRGNWINSFRLGVNRVVATTGLTFLSGNPLAADPTFGTIPGLNAAGVNVTGITAFTGGLDSLSSYKFHWTSIQVYDDTSLVTGHHSLKFGMGLERVRDNIFARSDPAGVFAFNSLADFLENKPFSLSAGIPGTQSERRLRQTIASVYVQDHWSLRPNLSLDLGLRYEASTVPSEVNNKLTVLRNLTDAAPHLGSPLFSNPTLRNLEPRIGAAWNPSSDGKTIISSGFGIFDVLPLPYLVQFNEVNSAPFTESGNATNLPVGSFPVAAFSSFAASSNEFRQAYFEPHPPRSYVMQWNLTVQRELAKAVSVTTSYVGSRGIHQPFRVEDADIVLPMQIAQGYFWPPAGTGQRLNLNAGRITAGFWRSDSYFHGLEAKFQGKIGKAGGEVSYTFGKTIDTSSGSIVGDEYSNSISSPLFFNPGLNRGLADFNVAHNLEVNYDWELGTPNWNSLGRQVLGGWKLGGVFDASTGVPFTPGIGGDALGLKSTDPSIDVPDLVPGPACGSLINPNNPINYIKTQCFTFPSPANRRGSLGRNTLIGPGLLTLDFSLIKNTYIKKVSDAFNVQFRSEFFNVLNRANFAPPLDNRNLFDASGRKLSNAGLITSTQTPSRQIQFAVKVIW